MLKSIQREERKKGTLSSHAFILQEEDIRFIVDKIWHGHSILSKKSEINNLRLPRWIKSQEWSPWNCVLLTQTESHQHNNIIELSKLYDENTIKEVLNRHALAKTAFKKLQAVEYEFTESGEWYDVGVKDRVV